MSSFFRALADPLCGVGRFFRNILLLWAVLALVPVILAFTAYPWRVYNWLGSDDFRLESTPEFVVVMGGGGIPSQSGLIRSYYGAEISRKYPKAGVVIALCSDGRAPDSDIARMKKELVMRGISADRILLEPEGRNTREQALKIAALLGDDFGDRSVLLVTSPNHMKRSLLTFRKAGFERVAGVSSFDTVQPVDMEYDTEELGGKEMPAAPKVGNSMFFRYTLWINLGYEFLSLQEFAALTYYWLQGWI